MHETMGREVEAGEPLDAEELMAFSERIDALVGRVAERDAALGQAMRRHADAFDYGPIETALRGGI